MLADGLAKGGVDRLLLHRFSNDCVYEAKPFAISHNKFGPASSSPAHDVAQGVGFEHRVGQEQEAP